MTEASLPPREELYSMVRPRLERLLDHTGGLTAQLARESLSSDHGVLSEQPRSLTAFLVPATCASAGADWHTALWPAVAAECMMTAADLLDDAADADGGAEQHNPGVLMTTAAGLLSLASAAVVRVVEDAVASSTAIALAELLGEGFASAANGQATNLQASERNTDALRAYREAAAKSGPLGSLIARLGARTATDDPEIVDALGEFGRRLAVRSQLLNDARDAAPEAAQPKADVRSGARTVPLAFVGSTGAPADLSHDELRAWEREERKRIASGGGLAAALALAEAERLGALSALQRLEKLGCSVAALRTLVSTDA